MAVKKKRMKVTPPQVEIPEGLKGLCIPIDSVKLWGKNPRRNDAAAAKLSAIIKEHGFRVPIVVDQEGIIRAGNTRYKAAKLLGMTHIPAVKQEFLSDTAATAFGLADNKASEWATWDADLLNELLGAKAFEGYKGKIGFNQKELDLFDLDRFEGKPPKDIDDDVADAYSVRVDGVTQEHKDAVIEAINRVVKELDNGYEAIAY